MTTEDPKPELQRDVQRLLGRCMLRLQQYERLLKTTLAHHELAGALDTLEAQRSAQVEKVTGKTLGQLAKTLFETYVVPDGFERNLLPDDRVPTDRISMAFRFNISMEPERWNQTKKAVEEMVTMRNELVHHLIERYDVWTEAGCMGAIQHLDACYSRIDQHFADLADWTRSTQQTRESVAELFRTPIFSDWLLHGIAPYGTFVWAHTGIVHALQAAAQALEVEGWTRLDMAREWISKEHPGQTPEKYNCRTWQQVLHESRLFHLQYRKDDSGQKAAWFCPKPSAKE